MSPQETTIHGLRIVYKAQAAMIDEMEAEVAAVNTRLASRDARDLQRIEALTERALKAERKVKAHTESRRRQKMASLALKKCLRCGDWKPHHGTVPYCIECWREYGPRIRAGRKYERKFHRPSINGKRVRIPL